MATDKTFVPLIFMPAPKGCRIAANAAYVLPPVLPIFQGRVAYDRTLCCPRERSVIALDRLKGWRRIATTMVDGYTPAFTDICVNLRDIPGL
jgi:hypothetical protein